MLQNIGDTLKNKRWLAYAMVAALALVFAAWGAYGIVDVGIGGTSYAAKVNGEEISLNEANELWQRQQAQLSQALGEELTPELREMYQQRLLDGQISNLAATQRARKLGFRVSDTQLLRAIQAEQAFHVDGVFNPQAYRSRLAAVGLSEAAFEADLKQGLLSEQLASAIGATDFLVPSEAARLLALQDEQREVRFVMLQAEDYAAGPAFTDAEIQAYYEANAAQYTPPEAVKLAYGELTLADVAQGVVVSDETLRDRYESSRDTYVEPERRRARHILVAMDGEGDDARARSEAEALHKRLADGEDFAALAKEASDDTASASQGGDLGWAAREAYVPAFADALFALAEGATSAPVKTPFGYHIIRVEGIRAGSARSFEDVKPELAAQLRSELAADAFGNRQEELQTRVDRGGAQLAQLVQEFGLRAGEVERFERGAGGLPLGSDAELNREVFSDRVLEQRQVGGPLPLGDDRITLVQVVEHYPPQVRPLADVRDEVLVALREQRGAAAAARAAEEALAKLEAGTSFDQLLRQLKLDADAARYVGRGDPDLPVALREAVFQMPRPAPGEPLHRVVPIEGGTTALLEVTNARSVPAIDDPQIVELRAQRELQRYSLRDVEAYFTGVVQAAKVMKNPEAFAR